MLKLVACFIVSCWLIISSQVVDAISPNRLATETNLNLAIGTIPLRQEIMPLKVQMQAIIAQYSSMSTGIFAMDVDSGDYVSIDGDRVFSAASTITGV